MQDTLIPDNLSDLIGEMICLAVLLGGFALGANESQGENILPGKLPRWKDNTGMVFIRGGEFVRGGQYKTRVRSFYMDQYEVTNQRYCDFLNDGNEKCWNKDQEIEKKDGKFVPNEGKERWPVYCVAWHEAAAYVKWAGKRLPTEAEWEWAAAGKEGRKYPWDNDPITFSRANFGRTVGHPQPVGSYPDGKTPEGIYDMSGNVAEWCSDWFDPGYYSAAPEDDPPGPEKGAETPPRRVRRGGCWAMGPEDQASTARGASPPDYRPKCIGIHCVRSARRVLVLLGENFEEIEFAAFTGVLSWASHTNEEGDYMFPRGKGEKEVSLIEVVVAGFAPEVRGMGSMCIRPDVLVQNLKPEEIDCFDAVAIPACVGGGRGQHTWKGQGDLESPPSLAIVRRVHEKGGIIATMCAAITVLEKAGLPFIKPGKDVDSNVTFEKRARTITCGGPRVATETACMLLKALVDDREYRSFRQYNPWLFGGKDEFAPRLDVVK